MTLSQRTRHILSFLNGFRKFTIMSALIIVGIVFRVLGYISGAEMVDLLRYTAVAFMATNGIEHMMEATKEWIKGKVKKEVEEAKNAK